MSVSNPDFNPSGNLKVDTVKNAYADLGQWILDNVEPGRRRSVALTQLETSAMWAVKAIVVGDSE